MNQNRHERQIRLFGEEGQKSIRESHAAVVGVGGLGSHLIQQLAFLGVGYLTLIDADEVKETDMNRLIGARFNDPIPGTLKVDIAKRLINSIDASIRVTTIPKEVVHKDSFSALKQASHVFGCVDNDGARLVINELCVAFEVPYIDLASDIENSTGLSYGGRVFTNFDGQGCLYCYELISPSDARLHLLSTEARRDQETIYGVPSEHLARSGPSVVSINGVVASLAVTEFMVLVVGLRQPSRLLNYHGHRGIVTLSMDKPYEDCYYCRSIRGQREKADVDRYWRIRTQTGEEEVR